MLRCHHRIIVMPYASRTAQEHTKEVHAVDFLRALGLTWEFKSGAGFIRGARNIETHFSTESAAPGEDARFPRAHEDAGRAGDARAPAAEGPLSPDPMRADRASASFPKNLRLLKRNEFRRVY